MESASVNEIKRQLAARDAEELLALCLKMAKFRKENKELLSYLLFRSDNEQQFIEDIMRETDEQFSMIVYSTAYKFAKQVRKILRYVNKHARYSGQYATQAELLMHFCTRLLPYVKERKPQTAVVNIYSQQIKKIHAALSKLHEDLQYDYVRQMERTGLIQNS